MALPKPSSSFTIPSLHDDLELDCRLYYPRRSEKTPEFFGNAFAIMAHPYAPLGGSYDDPVVAMAGSALLQRGVTLGTFNFRGAHGCAGRTSWSGNAELGDYVAFYGFMLCYLNSVQARVTLRECNNSSVHLKSLLVLGGYSYGSLIASYLPPASTISELFKTLPDGSAQKEIKLRAENLAQDLIAYLEMRSEGSLARGRNSLRTIDGLCSPTRGIAAGGYDSGTASRRISRESSRKSFDADRVHRSIDRARSKMKSRSTCQHDSPSKSQEAFHLTTPNVAYLLISPLLPPVAGLITIFSKPVFAKKESSGAQLTTREPLAKDEKLTSHPSCCIYGSKDIFTSHKKLRKWVGDLRSRPSSTFTPYEIDGAGHFWQEAGASGQLQSRIAEWLASLRPNAVSTTNLGN